MTKLKLWLKYDDGREYVEYRKPSIIPEGVELTALRESSMRAGNRPVESKWSYEDA